MSSSLDQLKATGTVRAFVPFDLFSIAVSIKKVANVNVLSSL
jgi:hypothetical protein